MVLQSSGLGVTGFELATKGSMGSVGEGEVGVNGMGGTSGRPSSEGGRGVGNKKALRSSQRPVAQNVNAAAHCRRAGTGQVAKDAHNNFSL